MPQCRVQALLSQPQRHHAQGARESVVAGLAGVDVVVWMHAESGLRAGQAGDDLVDVHVGGGPGAGLIEIDGEMGVVATLRDLGRRGADGGGEFWLDDLEFGVDLCGSPLDLGQGMHDGRWHQLAGNREVRDSAGGLRSVQGVDGHLHLTHGVVLGA